MGERLNLAENQQQQSILLSAGDDGQPRPQAILRLLPAYFRSVSSSRGHDTYGVAELYFIYPETGRLMASPTPTAIEHIRSGGSLQTVRRNAEFEMSVVRLLQRAGLDFASRRLPQAARVDSSEPCLLPGANQARFWSDFMMNRRAALEDEGLQFEVEEDFPYQSQRPKDWYIDVRPEKDDANWFTLELGVWFNGERINLIDPLAQWVRQPLALDQLARMQDEQSVLLRLADGRLLPIPAGRLRVWLDPILEFMQEGERLQGLRVPRTRAAQLVDLEAQPANWQGGEELRALGRQLRRYGGIQPHPPAPGFRAALRPYQQEGLNWLQFLRASNLAGILADDMGLGKTVQTLAHIHLEKHSGRARGPSMVIAPTSLIPNWQREAEKFAPDLKVIALQGQQRADQHGRLDDADLILTTYPLLVRDQDVLLARRYHVLVLDEAQFIKNPKSKAHKVALALDARHRLSLTGTPLENHLGELWAQFNFLMPGFLGNAKQFAQQFRAPIENLADPLRRKQLSERIRPFLLRRTKESVLKDLPKKTEIVRLVELEERQRELYESIRGACDEKLRAAISRTGVAKSQIMILDALLKLRQACCDPRLVKLETAHAVEESAKLKVLSDMLTELASEGRRILVFTQFTSMLKLIEAEVRRLGIGYVKLTGHTRDREAPVRDFQEGRAPVFLISLKAGGTGLNLTAADTVIHYDPWWNPAVEAQASARAHRIGQDKPVFVYKLIARGTVEEKIQTLQARKSDLAASMLPVGIDDHLIKTEDLDLLLNDD